MKNVLLLAAVCLSIHLYAQEVNIPEAVLNSFQVKYPSVKKVKWVEKGTEYQANFMDINQKQATFTAEGNWQKTLIMLKEEDIPESTMEMILEDFEDYEFKEARTIESANSETIHQVKLINSDDEKETLKFDEDWELQE